MNLQELNRAQVSSENVTSKYFQMLSCRQKQQLYSRWLVTVSFKTRKLQFLASDQNQTSIASTQVVALTPFSHLAPSYVFFHPKKEK